MVRWPLASPAGVGWRLFWRWSFLDQRRQAFAPNPGARCLRRPSGGACAASGLGSEGWGRTLHGGGAACGSGPDPSSHRRPEGNQPGLVVSSRITRCWGAVSSGWTPPARADWLRPPTRRGIRNLPSVGSGHRPGATPFRDSRRRISTFFQSTRQSVSKNPVAAGVSAAMPDRCPTPRTS